MAWPCFYLYYVVFKIEGNVDETGHIGISDVTHGLSLFTAMVPYRDLKRLLTFEDLFIRINYLYIGKAYSKSFKEEIYPNAFLIFL